MNDVYKKWINFWWEQSSIYISCSIRQKKSCETKYFFIKRNQERLLIPNKLTQYVSPFCAVRNRCFRQHFKTFLRSEFAFDCTARCLNNSMHARLFLTSTKLHCYTHFCVLCSTPPLHSTTRPRRHQTKEAAGEGPESRIAAETQSAFCYRFCCGP